MMTVRIKDVDRVSIDDVLSSSMSTLLVELMFFELDCSSVGTLLMH